MKHRKEKSTLNPQNENGFQQLRRDKTTDEGTDKTSMYFHCCLVFTWNH